MPSTLIWAGKHRACLMCLLAPVYAKFANTPKLQQLVKRIQDAK